MSPRYWGILVMMAGAPLQNEPLVSIVTPSFQGARFLEQAIESVLSQDYPHIEYVVMDGGSTDGTLDILEKYCGRLRFVSQTDGGQADAINRGFATCQGQIFAFLNSDDEYMPGAISAAVRGFTEHPDAAVVYGDAWHVDETGARISAYPVEEFDAAKLARRCLICQPAAFIRSSVFAGVGMLDASLQFSLDYDLWVRIAQQYPLRKIDATLAYSRLHAGAKTVGQTGLAMLETLGMLQRRYGYVPYNWLYGYGRHRLTGQALAAESPRADWASAVYSAAMGARYNWRHPLRYVRDIVATAKEGLAWASR